MKDQIVYLFLLLVLVVAAVVSPQFFQPANLFNILRQAAAIGILAIGQTIVVVAGGIDLSVAAVMQLSGVTVAEITGGQDALVALAIPLCLAMGLLIGLGNGLLVTKRRVQPFIATLFVGLLVTGLRLLVTRATPSGVLPPAIRAFGRGTVGPIPVAVLLFALVAVLASFVLRRTTLGRRIYAVGGNAASAELSGVRVDRITVTSYLLSGLLAAVAGIVLVGYLGYADQEIGVGYDLDSIAAVVVGGAVLGGGRGRVSGTVAGVLLMATLLNIVLLLNLKVDYQLVVRGAVILAAVALYSLSGAWAPRRRVPRCPVPGGEAAAGPQGSAEGGGPDAQRMPAREGAGGERV
jgi:ribose/xylose/arabinose/galactoside ABC-type transport system permease subunit